MPSILLKTVLRQLPLMMIVILVGASDTQASLLLGRKFRAPLRERIELGRHRERFCVSRLFNLRERFQHRRCRNQAIDCFNIGQELNEQCCDCWDHEEPSCYCCCECDCHLESQSDSGAGGVGGAPGGGVAVGGVAHGLAPILGGGFGYPALLGTSATGSFNVLGGVGVSIGLPAVGIGVGPLPPVFPFSIPGGGPIGGGGAPVDNGPYSDPPSAVPAPNSLHILLFALLFAVYYHRRLTMSIRSSANEDKKSNRPPLER